MIKSVVFDFGGVVVSPGFENWTKEYLPHTDVIHEEMMRIGPQVDRGSLPASAYTDFFAQVTGKSSQEINTEILLSYELQDDTVSLILQLRKNLKVGLIANFPTTWFDFLFEKFQLQDIFDSVFVSAKVHIIKPEAKIYQEILEQLHVQPKEAVFIDD